MSKYEFLGDLSRLLSDLPEDERKQALKYYEDYFADAGDDREQDVLRELGTPEKIARQLKEDSQESIEYGDGAFAENKNPISKFQKQDETENSSSESTASDNTWHQTNSHTEYQSYQGNDTYMASSMPQEDNGTKIVLVIILAILLSPIWGTGLVGVCSLFIGIFSALLGILAAFILGGGGLSIAGVCCFFGGIIAFLTGEFGAGILTIGLGCIFFSVGALLCYFGVMLCIKLFPLLCKGIGNFFQWCSKKFNQLVSR